jgi:hypothetical protein
MFVIYNRHRKDEKQNKQRPVIFTNQRIISIQKDVGGGFVLIIEPPHHFEVLEVFWELFVINTKSVSKRLFHSVLRKYLHC